MSETMSDTTARVCRRCGHSVPSFNFDLHELRCRGAPISSTVETEPIVEAKRPPPTNPDIEIPPSPSPPRATSSASRPRQTSEPRADSGWACSACTFQNDSSSFTCEMCGTSMMSQPGFSCSPTDEGMGFMRDETETVASSSRPQVPPPEASVALSSMGGAALGAIAGGFSNWMQGRSFTSGLTEGAVAGAVAGAGMGVLSLAQEEEKRRRRGSSGSSSSSSSSGSSGSSESRVPHPFAASSQSGPGPARVFRVSRDGGSTVIFTSGGGSGSIFSGGRGMQMTPHQLLQLLRQQQAGGPGGRWQGGMDVDHMSYEDLLSRFGTGNERKGAPASAIDSLPVHSYEKEREHAQEEGKASQDKDKDKESPRSCTICLDDFGDGDAIRTLPCFHTYHQPCIDRWLLSNNSCPVCKNPIT